MWQPTSEPITFWVRMPFLVFCLNSSQETPWDFGDLLEVLHGGGLHLLAQLVEALDQLGIGGDSQLGGLLQKQLLVDEIAEGVGLDAARFASA